MKSCHDSSFCSKTNEQISTAYRTKQQWLPFLIEYQNASTSLLIKLNSINYLQQILLIPTHTCEYGLPNIWAEVAPLDLGSLNVSYMRCADTWNQCARRGIWKLKFQHELNKHEWQTLAVKVACKTDGSVTLNANDTLLGNTFHCSRKSEPKPQQLKINIIKHKNIKYQIPKTHFRKFYHISNGYCSIYAFEYLW